MTLSLITHQTNFFKDLRTPKGGLSIVQELREKSERLMRARLISEIFKEQKPAEPLHRRDRHDIIAEILKTAKRGEKKTYIMYKARLSHSQLKLYLEFLNQIGMIVKDNGVYKTTSKGLTFIREFESINFLFRQ